VDLLQSMRGWLTDCPNFKAVRAMASRTYGGLGTTDSGG